MRGILVAGGIKEASAARAAVDAESCKRKGRSG